MIRSKYCTEVHVDLEVREGESKLATSEKWCRTQQVLNVEMKPHWIVWTKFLVIATVSYFFWPLGCCKNNYWDAKSVMNWESLSTSGLRCLFMFLGSELNQISVWREILLRERKKSDSKPWTSWWALELRIYPILSSVRTLTQAKYFIIIKSNIILVTSQINQAFSSVPWGLSSYYYYDVVVLMQTPNSQ